MATKTKNERRVRVSLDLNEQQIQRLVRLEEMSGTSKVDVIRNSLKLYEFIAERSLAGETFRIFDASGKSTDIVFLDFK